MRRTANKLARSPSARSPLALGAVALWLSAVSALMAACSLTVAVPDDEAAQTGTVTASDGSAERAAGETALGDADAGEAASAQTPEPAGPTAAETETATSPAAPDSKPTKPRATTVPNSSADAAATEEPETDSAVRSGPTSIPTTPPIPTPVGPGPRPAAPNGRRAPLVGDTPAQIATQIADAEAGLANEALRHEWPAWGHQHQVAIRKLGMEPAWDADVFAQIPSDVADRTRLHLEARRALLDLHSGYDAADFIPAWAIVEPEPLENLLAHYQQAEAATGIEWEYLAAINLIETGMGRIRGLSSAGAQGPMQFLPTTWDEPGIGQGDIDDPGDAIAAAARYLVRRGGPSDMAGALWGYNNSDNYVAAAMAYAELLRSDPDAYRAIYHWEIYFSTDAGDIWLPTGFRSEESMDLDDYLADNPWSTPDPELS